MATLFDIHCQRYAVGYFTLVGSGLSTASISPAAVAALRKKQLKVAVKWHYGLMLELMYNFFNCRSPSSAS